MTVVLPNFRGISWSDFFRIDRPEYVVFKIVPDSGARNWRSEDVVKTVADQFRLPIDRISKDGRKIRYVMQDRAVFEIAFEGGRVTFYLSVAEQIAPLMKRRMASVWPGATIEQTDCPAGFDPERSAVYEVTYRKHHLYSLHTDAKDNLPLDSLMEAGRLIGQGERGRAFTLLDPIHQLTYQNEISETWRKLRAGHAPVRWRASKREIFSAGLVGLANLIRELLLSVAEIFGGDEKENMYKKTIDPASTRTALEQATAATKQKPSRAAIRTYIWVVAESPEPARADLIARTLASAFGDLSADNELIGTALKGTRKAEALRCVEAKTGPRLKMNYNLMSTPEAAKIVQLAGKELQEKYPEIEHIDHKEVELAPRLAKEGMFMGVCTFKGTVQNVNFPVDNWDELCAPRVVVAGMGQGKTKGYAANFMVEAVRNGFGALAIDPAKGEIGDEVSAALAGDQVVRINLAQTVFSLDWCEMTHSPRARNRLANTIIDFFSANDETGGQTARFIRAAVMGMQTGKLAEVMKIFEDKAYRKTIIAGMNEGIHKSTMVQYDNESEGRQRQILSPIYNRLDMILGDEFLEQCLQSDESLDMVEIMRQKKAIIFDVPKRDLGASGVDLIVNLLTTKIDAAMTLRPEEEQFPFFVLIDEPHQFVRSQYVWEKAAVESRKWRVGYVWLFHEWLQLSRDLRRIIKSALPHYHFYPTSKEIWQDVKEEIYPHTLEEALGLKRFHAINVIRSGGQPITPFIMKMAAPPSERIERERG